MVEGWSRERQKEELANIERAIAKLLKEAEGFYRIDNGVPPNSLQQARYRFEEAVMWTESWIRRDE